MIKKQNNLLELCFNLTKSVNNPTRRKDKKGIRSIY